MQLKEINPSEGIPVYAVGDIHGMWHLFNAGCRHLDQLHGRNQYLLILMGDYTNRGPLSRRSLHILDKPNVEGLQGNHEGYYLERVNPDGTFTEKGLDAVSRFKDTRWLNDMPLEQRADRYRVISTLPHLIKIDNTLFAHGDIPYDMSGDELISKARNNELTDDQLEYMRLSRERFEAKGAIAVKGISRIFFGHAITPLLQRDNCVFIDTGAYEFYTGANEVDYPCLSFVRIDAAEKIINSPNIGGVGPVCIVTKERKYRPK